MQGDKDTTIPKEMSESAIKKLNKQSKLCILKGADHKFKGHEQKVIELSLSWFKDHLASAS